MFEQKRPIQLAAVLVLAGCSKEGAVTSAPADAPAPDGGRAEGGMPEASRQIGPLDVEALLAGNKALQCDGDVVDRRVDALLARMTLEQKVAEMHGLALEPVDSLYEAGGDASLGIPKFKMVDGPRGVRAGNATAFPVAMARGATWDPELERRVGLAIGLETAARGGNVLLAPTMNLLRHPGWGRAQETYSEDPLHMGWMAVGFIAGAQNYVLASAKHFAVNSVENTRFTMSANLDERTLREVYLPHFEAAVQVAKVASVMSAYNRVNGTYCAENAHLLRDILKGDWGFRGFVESDWVLGVRSTVPSLLAGLDIEMPQPNYYGQPVLDAVSNGEVATTVIDEAVRRILRQKLCFGLDDPASVPESVVESAEHRQLALEVARKSIVLLKNEQETLPLLESTKVAVVGELGPVANLGDRGSSQVAPSVTVSPLEGLRRRLSDAQVFAIETDTPTRAQLEQLEDADVAIVVAGLTYAEEGEYIPAGFGGDFAEGGDRADLDLRDVQVDLIRAVSERAARTVVVIEAGSALAIGDWVDAVDAVIMAWYPGMAGGTAIAEVLFGDVNPSGKTPVTFPANAQQLPAWDITSDAVDYGFLHGYRLLDSNGDDPLFPFGHGLGYSRFELGRLEVSSARLAPDGHLTVSVDLFNSGRRAGAEVVQIYVAAPESRISRAPKVLVGFCRAELQAGETVNVRIDVPAKRLAYWDSDEGAWAVERTRYTFHVGTSSRELPLSASVVVE